MTDAMVVDKRSNSIHVRISDQADAVLELMSQAAGGRAKADLLAELVERALLGEGHALRMAALRYARLGFGGASRDEGGSG